LKVWSSLRGFVLFFEAPVDGRYCIETTGETDVKMALYGPNDGNLLVAKDDDSGVAGNAKIERILQAGLYHVEVCHFSKVRTGEFASVVKQIP
jgi:hypothetical protein